MQKKLSKLILNQETVRTLTQQLAVANASHHACTVNSCNSVCGLPCTPKAGIQ
jgi:hypothetical protein